MDREVRRAGTSWAVWPEHAGRLIAAPHVMRGAQLRGEGPLPGCWQQEKKLDGRQLTELVAGFVQNITYRLPTEDTAAFGMLPPAIVVADGLR